MNKLEIKKPKFVEKDWGHELWIHNEEVYCGKLLVFNKGANFSLHFHMIKEETWYISKGEFDFIYIDGETTKKYKETLIEGDVVHIIPGQIHQLKALTQGATVFEISTQHFDYDSYRVTRKFDEEI